MNNKTVMAIVGAAVFTVGIICWLIYGGTAKIPVGNGVSVAVNATMKNSTITREMDGKKLWEFTVGEASSDKDRKSVVLKGIKGKLYRKDGSFVEVAADKGVALADKNDFSLEGNVKFIDSEGSELTTDKINYKQDKETITATGHVVMKRGIYRAFADEAITTSALESVKLKGHAKVEKGGQ